MHNIEIMEPYGSAYGYVVDLTEDNFWNMLDDYKVEDDPEVLAALKPYQSIAVLKNINVDEEARGKGYGNHLMGEFIDEASNRGAEIILLIADKAEAQAEGFNLVQWYEGFGFRILKQTVAGPLMITEE